MKENLKRGLTYFAGLVTLGFSLIPANLPFTLALRSLSHKGYNREIGLFLGDNSLDHLPFSLGGKFLYTFLPFIVLLGVLTLIWKIYHRKKLLSLITGTVHFRYKNFFRAFLLWSLFSAAADLILFLINPENYHFSLQLVPWIKLFLLGMVFIIPQVTLEEVFFRSYLVKAGTLLSGNPLFPLILFSLLFGLLHGTNPEVKTQGLLLMMPQYIGMGLFLAYLAWSSNGLEISLGVHMANNCWGILIVNAGGTAFKTPAPFTVSDWNPYLSLVALGAGIVFFLILFKSTKLFSVQKKRDFYLKY